MSPNTLPELPRLMIDEAVKSALLELCRTRLKENGITFWTSGDEQEILKILDYIRKPYTTAPLSPAATFFRRGEFFWIVFEADGEPVGVSALRYDDLAGETLGDFMARHATFLYGKNSYPAAVARPYPLLSQIRGKVVYSGDTYMAEGVRGRKNLHLRALIYLAYSLSMIKWPDMDYFYGIVRNKDMLVGKSAIYSVTSQLHSPLLWKIGPVERSKSEWLLGISAEDIANYAKLYLEEPELFDDIYPSRRNDRKSGVDDDGATAEGARQADAVVNEPS